MPPPPPSLPLQEFKLFLPLPDYASLQLLWRTLILRHGGAISDGFDLQTLSWISKTAGYTAGCAPCPSVPHAPNRCRHCFIRSRWTDDLPRRRAINTVVQKVLTQRRLQRLPIKPLSHTEFVPHLAKVDPVFKDEYEKFQAWTAKNNPQGKQEEKPKKEKADKKGGAKKKK